MGLARGRNSAFMDSCQLVRKETKMEVAHLNQKQLAARWCISEATLERRGSAGIGLTTAAFPVVREKRF